MFDKRGARAGACVLNERVKGATKFTLRLAIVLVSLSHVAAASLGGSDVAI